MKPGDYIQSIYGWVGILDEDDDGVSERVKATNVKSGEPMQTLRFAVTVVPDGTVEPDYVSDPIFQAMMM